MSYFTGEYECKVDAKGRVVLPSRIKSALPATSGTSLVIKRGFEPCLVLYPQVEWAKIFSKVNGLNEFDPEFRNFQRNFFRGSTEVELDGNGRLLIPRTMSNYAGLERDVVMVGLGNRVEVWNPERYEEYLIQDQEEFSKMAKKYLTQE